MAVDLLCEILQIEVLPLAAAAGPSDPALFLAFERLAFTGGVTIANGLYTAGLMLMNLCLRGTAGVPARLVGWISVASGFSLSALALGSVSPALQAATGSTIVFYCLWAVLAARDLQDDR
jgi:hypothetical protein